MESRNDEALATDSPMSGKSNSERMEERTPRSRRHHLKPFRDNGPTFVLRQWLNILFIIGAIAGIVVLHVHSRELGIYIFISASVLKFIEISLRLLKL